MKKMSFEAALERLEKIAQELENDQTELEKSLKLFEESTQLIAFCDKTLKDAKLRVETVSASLTDSQAEGDA